MGTIIVYYLTETVIDNNYTELISSYLFIYNSTNTSSSSRFV